MRQLRFLEVDGLRGIAALLVAVFHFDAISFFSDIKFIENSWLFVDFFFVLSGFIIAFNYEKRISDLNQLRDFILLRLGRLFPLHIVMVILFLIVELLLLVLSTMSASFSYSAFQGTRYVLGLVLEFTLLHALPFFPDTSWNAPSWSISVEFAAYIAFGLVVLLSVTKFRRVVYGMIILWFGYQLYVSPLSMESSHELAIYRCIFGFFVGVLLYKVYLHVSFNSLNSRALFTFFECVALGVCIAYVSAAESFSSAKMASLVFFVVIFPFLYGKGGISVVLRTRPFQMFGNLSYAVYMSHTFVFSAVNMSLQFVFQDFVARVGGGYYLLPDASQTVSLATGTLLLMVVITAVLVFSHFLNIFIEVPYRNKMKNWVKNRTVTKAAQHETA